ncbi:MAG: hypothetical protein R3190_14615, partial [Thermoanaerobaculia bacterium]|nr:hypothetical protein [Thermoanaerobaculia bacterium]
MPLAVRRRGGTRRFAVAAIAAAAVACGDSGPPPSELELEIEALRRRAPRSADSPAEIADRLDTLERWAEARSASGRTVPMGLPRLLHLAAQTLSPAGPAPSPEALESLRLRIEAYSEELGAKDDDPQSIGAFELAPPGPFTAGARVTLVQSLEIGSRSLEVGGGVVVPATGALDLQSSDAAAPGYVTVTTSRDDARLELSEPWSEVSDEIDGPVLAWRLSGVPLTAGDTLRVEYGAGGDGAAAAPTAASDFAELPVLIDFRGDGRPWTIATPPFAVTGRGEVAGLRVLGPSVVAPGETFDLVVRSEDRH